MAYVQFNNYIEPDLTSNESSVITNQTIPQESRKKKNKLSEKSIKNYLSLHLDILEDICSLVNKLKEELNRINKHKIKRISGLPSTSPRKFNHPKKKIQKRREIIEISE